MMQEKPSEDNWSLPFSKHFSFGDGLSPDATPTRRVLSAMRGMYTAPSRTAPLITRSLNHSSPSRPGSNLRKSGAIPPEIASKPWQRAQFCVYAEAPI